MAASDVRRATINPHKVIKSFSKRGEGIKIFVHKLGSDEKVLGIDTFAAQEVHLGRPKAPQGADGRFKEEFKQFSSFNTNPHDILIRF